MAALGYGFHKARQFERFRFLALPAAGAVGLALMIYLFLGVHMLAARYLMGILPLLALGMACALISAFAHPVLKWSFPVLLGTGLAMSLYVAYSDHRPGAEGWRESAAWVEDRCRPSDLILLNAPGIRVAFDRYFTGQAAEAGIGNETDARRMARKLQDVTHNRKRVWAVFSHTGPERGKEIIEQWLSLNYPRRIRQAFPGIEVCLFEKPSRY